MSMEDSEIAHEVAIELGEAVEWKRSMQIFLASEGWQKFKELVEKQIGARRDQLELEPIEDMLQLGVLKGEISMARAMLSLPETIIETSDMTIQSMDTSETAGLDEEEDEDNE